MQLKRTVAAGAAALAATVVPVAAGRSEQMAPVRIDARSMVLQLVDVPGGFWLEHGRYVSNADLTRQGDAAKDYGKLGRLTGYDVSYQRRAATGMLGLDSFASVYRSSSGAHTSFVLAVSGAARQGGAGFTWLRIAVPLGSETRVYRVTTTQSGMKLDFYTVAWRHGRVFAEVIGGGISGTMVPRELLALAKKQEARISSALD
jgi:hypothetical protein